MCVYIIVYGFCTIICLFLGIQLGSTYTLKCMSDQRMYLKNGYPCEEL